MKSLLVVAGLALALAPPVVHAQSSTPSPSSPQGAEERARLEEEIREELGGGPSRGAPSGSAPLGAAPTPQGQQGARGGNPLARLLLMPDLSAIASFTGVYDSYDVAERSPDRGELLGAKGVPTFLFQEIELGLQAVVDPYFRADLFIAFTAEGVDVEEAYATTLALPWSLQLRAGQLFSPFGRMNQLHPHAWEFVDPPLARGRLLAEEVLSGPGVIASWLAPTPWFAQLELAAQSTAPAEDLSPEPTVVARVLQYVPLGEADTLGVGLSAARRREGAGGAFRDLGGADVYFRHRAPGSRSHLSLQGELYLRRFRDAPVPGGEPGQLQREVPQRGWWAQAFWRQSSFLGYGVRYEEAPAAGASGPGKERRLGAVLDWYPSEFSRVALQVSDARVPGGTDGFEGLLHFEFGIGAHGAHPF